MMSFLESIGARLGDVLGSNIPVVLGAFALLMLGWVVARLLGSLVEKALHRSELDNRIARLFVDEDAADTKVERFAGRVTFWVAMLFVIGGFFEALSLSALTEPLNGFLTQVFAFLPAVVTAVVLLALAVLLARAGRFVVGKALTTARLDERLSQGAHLDEGAPSTTKALSEATYYLVLLLFLPAILETLSLDGLLAPVTAMFEGALAFVPNLIAAGAILVVGWFVARVLRQLTAALLASVGIDRLAERVGMDQLTPDGKLSSALSTVVYAVVLIPVLIAALDALSLEALTAPTSAMLAQLLEVVPSLLGAVLILGITWVLARVVSELLRTLAANVGVDGLAAKLGLPAASEQGVQLSAVIGHLAMAAILLFGAMEAFDAMGFELVSGMVYEIIEFATQVLLGALILAVGSYVAQLAGRVFESSEMSHARLLSMVARSAILVLAGAMALRRMGLANDIVNAAFISLLGAIGVAAALAFGLGGRETAGKVVAEWHTAMKERRDAPPAAIATTEPEAP